MNGVLLMKKTSLVVAMLAAFSMVVTPVTPVKASEPGESGVSRFQVMTAAQPREKIAAHAQKGEAAILSKAQVDKIAKTNPQLHARLMAAYRSGTVPTLSASEKKMLVSLTHSNLEEYKAGNPLGLHFGGGAALAAGGWFAVGLIVLVALFLFLLTFMPSALRSR